MTTETNIGNAGNAGNTVLDISGSPVVVRLKAEHLAVGTLIIKNDYGYFENGGLPYWVRYILSTETGIIYTSIVRGVCDGRVDSCRADTMKSWGCGYFEISEEDREKVLAHAVIACLKEHVKVLVGVRDYLGR